VVGVVDQSPDAVAQCADCVAARAESDGERWFCDAHAAPDRETIASAFVAGPAFTTGGLMW
jgi:hypothetical protein